MHADRNTISALVPNAVTWQTEDRHALATLHARLYGAGSDRLEPAALPWVRSWGPRRVVARPPACSCAASRRCSTCG
jgi:hypothetical protein